MLVRVHASLVSSGTELAPYRALARDRDAGIVPRLIKRAATAAGYARLAARHPDKAMAKMARIAKGVILHARSDAAAEPGDLGDQGWTLGYSVAGHILAVGEGVTGFSTGDLVACAGAGIANHADVVAVPVNLACKASSVSSRYAAFATVGAIALQGVRRAQPELGNTVAVIGLGLLGVLSIQLLVAAGCRVIGFDRDGRRVGRALGFGLAAGSADEAEFLAILRDGTSGWGADRVLVCAATASDRPVNLAMEAIRRKGVVVIVGDVGLNVTRADFFKKEADLLISTSYGPGRYDPEYEERGRDYPLPYVRWTMQRNMQVIVQMIKEGRLAVDAMIDREASIDQAGQLYAELADDSEGVPPLAVLLTYDETATAEDGREGTVTLKGARPCQGKVAFALAGTGAFGQSMLLPAFRAEQGFVLWGVISRDGVRGGNLARQEGAPHVSSSIASAAVSAPPPDVVIIATRHDRHADETIQALTAGLHVFVEKPLALTWEDLDRVAQAHDGSVQLMVGFNRRFSPAVQALITALEGRRGPLLMTYRMNAGRVPRDHWIQTVEGGGRNLGEACHIYDVLRALAGCAATSVQAAGIDPGQADWLCNDNFSALVTYRDGSLGTVIYTAMGPKQGLPKERLEVFCDGEAYLLDDYRSVTRVGNGAVLWSGATDKGHREEVRRFCQAVRDGGAAPIPIDEVLETSAVALTVEDQLFGRGGG